MDLQTVEDFFKNYDNLLSREGLRILSECRIAFRLQKLYRRLKTYKGEHLSNCIWADDSLDDEDHEICPCAYYYFLLNRFQNILKNNDKMYPRISNLIPK